MKNYFVLFLKGIAMGVANVIPGVSGGTIALITGIYEQLINSLKSFDKTALQLIMKFDIKSFINHTNLYFLISVFGGSIVSVFSIASLFKFLFNNYPLYIWSFFFGLILISILFVGKTITKWNKQSIISLIFGTIVAISFTYISPATENDNLLFVFFCGIIGISGMMLPGLFAGSVFGIFAFSHLLSWLLKKYKDQTLALLTGFIAGSLAIIWPWKEVSKSIVIAGKEKIIEYDLYLPTEINMETFIAISMIILGVLSVYAIEKYSEIK